MSWALSRCTSFAAALLLASTAARSAHAQDPFRLPADFLFKSIDEWRLQHDEARLQNDISQGDADRVNRDLKRIRRDEWMLWYDRRRIRRDMFLPPGPWASSSPRGPAGGTLVPHPQYPGYGYDPSNPTQLYLLAQPQPQPAPIPGPSPGSPVESPSTPTPEAATAPAGPTVVVVNAGPPGTTITYVVDGIAYHTEGGQQQRLTIRPTSTIVYDRGGGLGEQRYALSSGVYEFESGDTGWALFKRPAAPEDTGRTLSIRIPKNELPATSGALRNNGSGLPPAIPVEGSNTDSRSESTARDARTR